MRIISGIYGGRRFNSKAPKGVRPTLDAVKESMFNILNNNFDFDSSSVLDLCCGTGCLGIEALSRGADYCDFVDKSKGSIEYAKSFLEYLKIDKSTYEFYISDAYKFLVNIESMSYNLIFTDPPYIETFISKMIQVIEDRNILKQDGLMVAEFRTGEKIILPANWETLTARKNGETTFEIYLRK